MPGARASSSPGGVSGSAGEKRKETPDTGVVALYACNTTEYEQYSSSHMCQTWNRVNTRAEKSSRSRGNIIRNVWWSLLLFTFKLHNRPIQVFPCASSVIRWSKSTKKWTDSQTNRQTVRQIDKRTHAHTVATVHGLRRGNDHESGAKELEEPGSLPEM